MDSAKAKSIIIFILIFLNVFLFGSIGMYKLGEGVSRETLSNTREILNSRGMELQCQIPRYNKDTYSLVYENGYFDRVKIAKNLLGNIDVNLNDLDDGRVLTYDSKALSFESNNTLRYTDSQPSDTVDISSIDKVKKYLKKITDGIGLQLSVYDIDLYSINEDGSITIEFVQTYKDFFVYDNYIKATVTKNGITEMKCSNKRVKGFSTGKAVKIMPAYQVLLKNFGKGDESVITNIDLGYKGIINMEKDMKESREVPVWRVKIQDGTKRYFTTGNGDEIK